MGSYIIGIGGIIILLGIWVAVQSWWGKTFKDHLQDDDVLAGRTSCGNCGCTSICTKNQKIISE